MAERKFIWDEFSEGISLFGASKLEDNQNKNKARLKQTQNETTVFCPHSYLVFNFQEALTTSQEMRFRKYFMRKVEFRKKDVVLLQDIKNLVLFLVTSQISIQFISFFHLPIADRFLRALIIYFEFYLETWEELMQRRNATEKKIKNPLSTEDSLRRSKDLNCLRCILAKEYANLLIGCEFASYYHHTTAGEKSLSQSQHEKDLRIFETLFAVSHQIVWIALHRKHYNLIEIELHRLFRTESYNTAERKNPDVMSNMKESELLELHGPKMRTRRKLLRNSSLPYQLLNSVSDFRLLALENVDSKDPRVIFFQKALLLEEEKLSEFGIKVGILGMPRFNFDHLLLPISEPGEKEDETSQDFLRKINIEKSFEEIPIPGPKFELDLKILPEPKFTPNRKLMKENRKKWIERAISLSAKKQKETPSVTTTWELN